MAADRLRKPGPDDARPEPYAPLGWAPAPEPVAPTDPYAAPGAAPPRGYPPPTSAPQALPGQGLPPQALPSQAAGQARPHGPLPYGQETSSRAVVALVLALASFLVCPLLPAVAALFVARGAQAEVRESGGRLTGEGLARAATVLSWINIAVCVVTVVGLVALVALVAGA